jgi:hypothetical protein
MRQPIVVFVLAAAMLPVNGCATTEPGWTGTGAQPFDQALSECHAQVDVIAVQQKRESALEVCMAEKGWTRK